MKLLQAFVMAGILAGTAACQQETPKPENEETSKPENVSVEPGSLPGTATTGAGVDNPQLDPGVQRLKEQLSLTEQQTNQLNEIFQDTNAQRKALNAQRKATKDRDQRAAIRKQKVELHKNKREQINAVLTPEQAKKYEQILSEPPPEAMEDQPQSPEDMGDQPQPPQPTK